jgi:hypothetical protein
MKQIITALILFWSLTTYSQDQPATIKKADTRYYYEYRQEKHVETLVDRKAVRQVLYFQNSKWSIMSHNLLIVASDAKNILKNVGYKVNKTDPAKPPVNYNTNNFGHYGQLAITATLGKGKFAFVDVTLSADEYKDEIQVIKFNSPLTPLEGLNFSIKLPKNINTIHGDSLRTATTAVLT